MISSTTARTSNLEFLHTDKGVKICTHDALYIFLPCLSKSYIFIKETAQAEILCTLQLYVLMSKIIDDVTTNCFTVYEENGRWIGERHTDTDGAWPIGYSEERAWKPIGDRLEGHTIWAG